jgi:hypothetical protein
MDVRDLREGDANAGAGRVRATSATACLLLTLLAGCAAPGGTGTVKVESPTPQAASTPRQSPSPQATAAADAAAAAAAPGASLKKTNLTPEDRRAWRKLIEWPDECEEAYEGTMSKAAAGLQFHELAGGQYLVEVLCTSGAYQGYQFYSYLDETKSPPAARLLTFQTFQSEGEGAPKKAETQEMWGLATFDAASKSLEIHNRYRGPGDCGSLATYEFPDGTPRLKEFREKSECDGKYVEPRKWKRIFP